MTPDSELKPDFLTDDIPGLRRILSTNRRIAVVGLSASWHRPSYFAAKYLKDHSYQVIPVNPRYEQVLDEPCYASLFDIPDRDTNPVDIVDCFRRAEDIPPLVDEAIAIGAKVLWLQLGVINIEAARKAHEAGLEVVMDRCMKIEYARFFGGLGFIGVNTRVISARRSKTLAY
jgi:predicted CoA-binding protein